MGVPNGALLDLIEIPRIWLCFRALYIYILIFDLGLVLILDIKIETHVSCI
jgi:hypothetical protein